MTARSRLDVDARRAQLIELGLELFGVRAYDEVSIDDIATRAGISKGLLYHYFGGKRDFYVACVQVAADRLVETIRPDESLPPLARAILGLKAYLDFVEERADAFVALVHGGLGLDAEVMSILEGVRVSIVDEISSGLGLSGDRPVFRTAFRAWLGAVEASSLEWLKHRDVSRSTLVRLLTGSLQSYLAVAIAEDPEGAEQLAPMIRALAGPAPPAIEID